VSVLVEVTLKYKLFFLYRDTSMISTFYWVLLQICIANPNQDVLLTLTKAGIVELIGKEWYFVRVHDAVQVCLQHVQSLNQTPKNPDSFAEDKPSFFQRLSKQREEDLSIAELESGDKITEPHLEPLLSRKS
jgi:sulfate transporter 4